MRRGYVLAAALLALILALGGPAGALTLPASLIAQPEAVSYMKGDVPALKQALREPSAVRYQIMLAADYTGGDLTAYLDRVLDQQGWPAADQLLLIIFPGANHNIRFAMGANFRKEEVSVGEMVALLHERYFPHVHKGDPAAGLASLIRAVNQRMAPADPTDGARVMRETVAAMQAGDWQALANMVGEKGLFVAPFRVGLPAEGLKGEAMEQTLQTMLAGASPHILAYDLRQPGAARVVVEGLNPAGLVTATAMLALEQRADGAWGLAFIVIDGRGDLLRQVMAEGFQAPLSWLSIHTDMPLGAGAAYYREPPGPTRELAESHLLSTAREFLRQGVMLPAELEGRAMLLYREYDEQGRLLVSGLHADALGFSARYRPAGDHHIRAEYGDGYVVKVEELTVAGRPARIVRLAHKTKDSHLVELWLEDGLWVYELRDEQGDTDRLIKLAESLK